MRNFFPGKRQFFEEFLQHDFGFSTQSNKPVLGGQRNVVLKGLEAKHREEAGPSWGRGKGYGSYTGSRAGAGSAGSHWEAAGLQCKVPSLPAGRSCLGYPGVLSTQGRTELLRIPWREPSQTHWESAHLPSAMLHSPAAQSRRAELTAQTLPGFHIYWMKLNLGAAVSKD